MRKIAIVTHYDLSVFQGGEKFAIYLANALAREGNQVTIYSLPLKKNAGKPEKYLAKGVKYIRTSFTCNIVADTTYYIYAPLLYRILFRDRSERKIAGLHGFVVAPELSSKDLWNMSFPRFLRCHGPIATIAYYYLKLFKEKELQSFQLIHKINPFTSLADNLKKKAVYIPLWTEYKRTLPLYREAEDRFTILMLRTGSYLKGKDVCEAILNFFSKRKEFKITFLSNNSSFNNYKHVKFLGFIPEERMPHLLSSVHVVLYPSRLDTFGMTIIEALNCGTPVITSDILAHKIFRPPAFLCNEILDYIRKLIYLYRIWEAGSYYLVRKWAMSEGIRFSKSKIFPYYKKLFLGEPIYEST